MIKIPLLTSVFALASISAFAQQKESTTVNVTATETLHTQSISADKLANPESVSLAVFKEDTKSRSSAIDKTKEAPHDAIKMMPAAEMTQKQQHNKAANNSKK